MTSRAGLAALDRPVYQVTQMNPKGLSRLSVSASLTTLIRPAAPYLGGMP